MAMLWRVVTHGQFDAVVLGLPALAARWRSCRRVLHSAVPSHTCEPLKSRVRQGSCLPDIAATLSDTLSPGDEPGVVRAGGFERIVIGKLIV